MERYRVHFTYRGGRFDGRKGKRTVRANDKQEAGSRLQYKMANNRDMTFRNPRYITIDRIEPLPQENK